MKKLCVALIGILFLTGAVQAQTTVFNYQGRLLDGSAPANGSYDFQFSLYDAGSGGTQVGSTITRSNVLVNGGIFSTKLDFGDQFPGDDRYLEISVRPAGSTTTPYSTLSPRQRMTSAPYAIKSKNAATADVATIAVNAQNADAATVATNAINLGNIPASSYVLTNDFRLSNARTPLPNSGDYIQNRTTEQATSNFNISGTGRADIFDAGTQFNIAGDRVLSVAGTNNTFVGFETGTDNTITGNANSFFGAFAGSKNTIGDFNAFFGARAGQRNTEGVRNVFIGADAGTFNTTGEDNTFLGDLSGRRNETGNKNVFVGAKAGENTDTGNQNTFVGYAAGRNNETGNENSVFGFEAGYKLDSLGFNSLFGSQAGYNTTGRSNSFFGRKAGYSNTSGFLNTALGSGADFGAGNLINATAIGAGSVVSNSNEIALGRVNGNDRVYIYGRLRLNGLDSGGVQQLCRNAASFEISTCSSSLRYKTNINPFKSGLSLVDKLQPITFNWKEGGMLDLGLGAEDVAKIEPLLVTYNKGGQVEGVKYDRIGVVLLNAVREQQQQIEVQRKEIEVQQKRIESQQKELAALKALVCAANEDAEICQTKEK